MQDLITGIHHITAISGNAQRNIDFYCGILGLQLVKKTVNYDYSEVYHFYFGNAKGDPGTLFTTFPYGDDLPEGRHGKGKINTTAFSLSLSGVDYWEQRLKHFNVAFKPAQQRFTDEAFIYLEDPDGMGIELTFNNSDTRPTYVSEIIPEEFTIKGIHHAETWIEGYEKSEPVLTQLMGFTLLKESSNRFRFGKENLPGKFIDLVIAPNTLKGIDGRGMVHHIAFSTPSNETQLLLMEKMESLGLRHTGVRDRKYFNAIYFNEPGGVLFEVATVNPGFFIDEPLENLGKTLALPEMFEAQRTHLETILPKISFNAPDFKFD